MDRRSGIVFDRGDYLVVKTPSRPNYYWGNYLMMKGPPRAGDLDSWVGKFEAEFGRRMDRGFIALTWDSVDGDQGVITPFADFGFSIQKSTILTAQSICKPPKYNPDLAIRQFESDKDWDDYVEIHFDPNWRYGDPASQRQFLKASADQFREIVDAGCGVRLGVEFEGNLIGDAGLYWAGNVGRFNAINTPKASASGRLLHPCIRGFRVCPQYQAFVDSGDGG